MIYFYALYDCQFLSNEENIKAVEYAIEHNKLVIVTVSKHGKKGNETDFL